jgi:DNA-3-methyladenine glycosylase
MFGDPGVSYIYLVYGMYHCLNIVTEDKGSPSAVLIRGIDFQTPKSVHMDGPGKLCRYMAMTRDQNGVDLTTDTDFYIKKGLIVPHQIEITPRIGIKVGQDKLWRFIIIKT